MLGKISSVFIAEQRSLILRIPPDIVKMRRLKRLKIDPKKRIVLRTVNMTNYGIDQSVWTHEEAVVDAEDLSGEEQYQIPVVIINEFTLTGVFYGIKNGLKTTIFYVKQLSDIQDLHVFPVDHIFLSEHDAILALERME